MDNISKILKYKSFRAKRTGLGTPSLFASQSILNVNRRSRFQDPEKYVCRLQNSMPLKFREMVKTHLSTTLEIQPAELETLLTVTHQPITRRKSTVSFIKKKTQQQNINSAKMSPSTVDPILKLINYLSQDDVITTEGLFRKTGNICRQKQLKAKLESASATQKDMDAVSPHDCANVLKSYIKNLPEPLLTQTLLGVYNKITNITRQTKDETRSTKLHAMQLVLQLLPTDNLRILKPLMTLLNRAAFVSSNLMSAYSLSIIFAPHLLCDRHSSPGKLHAVLPKISDIVMLMIESGSQIFQTPKDLTQSASNFWREMELPNQLYYNTVQTKTDIVQTPMKRTSSMVHVVDLGETNTAEPVLPTTAEPVLPTTSPKPSRKRLASDTSDGIPEKRPYPEMFLSPDCKVFHEKPKLSKQTNSIIFNRRSPSSTKKPVARVKPIPQSPISQFFKNVPQKLQRVMSTPRSRVPMALFHSPACNF